MIDRRHIGLSLPPHTVAIELGRLRQFGKAIGETDPIYIDETAAGQAGYRSVPVPPTFLFCLEMEKPDPFDYLTVMGVDIGSILHGEQSFSYHLPVCAGDTVSFQSTISDIYQKKGGLLEFVIRDTMVSDRAGKLVAEMRTVMVVRNRAGVLT